MSNTSLIQPIDTLCEYHKKNYNVISVNIPKYGDLQYKRQVPPDLYAHIKCKPCREKYEDSYAKGFVMIPSPKQN
jgi:hypothetical protein